MKLFSHTLAAIVLAAVSSNAYSGTPVLGFEIGLSTLEQVSSTLAEKTKVNDIGTNKFSYGPMLQTDGRSYGIEGLNNVTYIFDNEQKLMGVIMNMNKDRFDAIFKLIAKKYKVTTQDRPFVGNQFARFKTTDGVIDIDAPHMSFKMDISYLRNDLFKKFNVQSKDEADSKKKSEAGQF